MQFKNFFSAKRKAKYVCVSTYVDFCSVCVCMPSAPKKD